MISCILKGGLGNQMFQIAAVLSIAVNRKVPFLFDKNTWPDRGGAGSEAFQASSPEKYLNNVFRKLPFKEVKTRMMWSVYSESTFHYTEIPDRSNILLNGYFQSERYFENSKEVIRKVFSPPKSIVDEFKRTFQDKHSNKDLISIHVRRGSHLRNPHYHGSCDAEYFRNAVSFFNKDSVFLVFSDDIQWCRDNFVGDNYVFVEGREDYEDLYYMSLCDHNIICNSTFSWWSAWLNNNKNKTIISPKKWFGPGYAGHDLSDLTPKGWTIIDNELEGE